MYSREPRCHGGSIHVYVGTPQKFEDEIAKCMLKPPHSFYEIPVEVSQQIPTTREFLFWLGQIRTSTRQKVAHLKRLWI